MSFNSDWKSRSLPSLQKSSKFGFKLFELAQVVGRSRPFTKFRTRLPCVDIFDDDWGWNFLCDIGSIDLFLSDRSLDLQGNQQGLEILSRLLKNHVQFRRRQLICNQMSNDRQNRSEERRVGKEC